MKAVRKLPIPARVAVAAAGVPPRAGAFTLIELLTVIGLMALLAGGIGLSLADSRGVALARAQTELAAQCAAVRTQAVVHQTEARLFIHATRPPSADGESFLRLLQVFRAEPAGSDHWVPAAVAVRLPPGTALVPPTMPGLLLPEMDGTDPEAPRSTLSAGGSPPSAPSWETATTVLYLECGADGSFRPNDSDSSQRLVVSTVIGSAGDWKFNPTTAVRGVIVRPTGAIAWVNDPAGF